MTILRGRPGLSASDDEERTVRIARRRFVRRRWARRWLAWRRLIAALLVVAVVVGSVWLVFFSSVLAVRTVDVTGVHVLSPAAVRRAADAPIGQPLATADLAAIRARVAKLAPVAMVDVSRQWPDGILIEVTERHPVALVADGAHGLRGLDAHGVLFRSYAHRPRGLPLLHLSAQPGAGAVAEAAKVAAALPSSIARRVSSVEVATVDTISLRLRNGRTVLWGNAGESADKARVLAVLLRDRSTRRSSYFDVSVPGQPIVRP